MGFWTHSNPASTESLATSQGLIQSNFTMIQGVLGSSTLSAGITYAQGDILYASGVQYVQKLAKASESAMLTNFGATNNPSWVPISSITDFNGMKSAIALEAVGTIKVGAWSGTTIAAPQGGTGYAGKMVSYVLYCGTGVNPRNVAHGLADVPDYAMISRLDNTDGITHNIRTKDMPNGQSRDSGGSIRTDGILSFTATNVVVGDLNQVNTVNISYTLLAIKGQ